MTKSVQFLLIALGCVLLGLAVNYGTLSAGWRWDDSLILVHAHQYSWFQDLLQPEIWKLISPANLTPLVTASYEIDLILFGLSPGAFYLHQLLAICAGAFMLALVLRLWCPTRFAVFGAVLFLSGLPVMIVAEQLMTRHYAEGLVAALLSLYGYVRFLRTQARSALFLAFIMYVFACLAKEIYVPLPLLFLILPERDFRFRCQTSVPFFLAIGLYTLWRGHMLGSVVGGYSPPTSYLSVDFFIQILLSFANFPNLLFGSPWVIAVCLYGVLLILYWRSRLQNLWRGVFLSLLIFLPLVPLVQYPGIVQADRYLFLVWALLCFSIPFMASNVWNEYHAKLSFFSRAVIAATILLLPIFSFVHAWPIRTALATSGEEFDVQGRFIIANDDTQAIYPSRTLQNDYFFLKNLRELKQALGQGTAPLVIVDDLFLPQAESKPLYRWEPTCRCMMDVSSQIPQLLEAFDTNNQPSAALHLQYLYEGDYFSWEFGPYTEGNYQLISEGAFNMQAPSYAGQLIVTVPDGMPIFVRYNSPEGWFTYSELQYIYHNQDVRWRRD